MSRHAKEALTRRKILPAWIEGVLEHPAAVEKDMLDASLEHRLGRVAAHGNRILRVVCNVQANPVRVVTAYFDRRMGSKL